MVWRGEIGSLSSVHQPAKPTSNPCQRDKKRLRPATQRQSFTQLGLQRNVASTREATERRSHYLEKRRPQEEKTWSLQIFEESVPEH